MNQLFAFSNSVYDENKRSHDFAISFEKLSQFSSELRLSVDLEIDGGNATYLRFQS
jgi:hypothetical protein